MYGEQQQRQLYDYQKQKQFLQILGHSPSVFKTKMSKLVATEKHNFVCLARYLKRTRIMSLVYMKYVYCPFLSPASRGFER